MAKRTAKAKIEQEKMKAKKAGKQKQHAQEAAAGMQLANGTKLQKLDRAGTVRCECIVEEGGYRYGKTVFRSLSAAAAAAAQDLGLAGKSFNGYVFWGLTKPGRQNTLDRMDHFFRRYSEVATQLARVPEQKARCLERVRKHIAQLQAVAQ
jgi:hypothetical protein